MSWRYKITPRNEVMKLIGPGQYLEVIFQSGNNGYHLKTIDNKVVCRMDKKTFELLKGTELKSVFINIGKFAIK